MPDTAQGTPRMAVTARRYAHKHTAQKALNRIRNCATAALQDLEMNRPAGPAVRQITDEMQALLAALAAMAELDRVASLMVNRAA